MRTKHRVKKRGREVGKLETREMRARKEVQKDERTATKRTEECDQNWIG